MNIGTINGPRKDVPEIDKQIEIEMEIGKGIGIRIGIETGGRKRIGIEIRREREGRRQWYICGMFW